MTEERLPDQDEQVKAALHRLEGPMQAGDSELLRKQNINRQKGQKWSEQWERPYRVFRKVKKESSFELLTLDGVYLKKDIPGTI